MAKKKPLQQLDLFGEAFAEQPAPVQDEKQEAQPAYEPIETTVQSAVAEETPLINDTRQVVFADDKIGVKIKLKTPVQPVVTTSEVTVELTSVEATNSVKQEELVSIAEESKVVEEEPVVIIESVTAKEFKPAITKKYTKRIQSNIEKPKSKRGRKSFKEMDEEVGLINIPDEDELNKKLYYPIREVAAFFNVNTSLIRAWEVEFDILQPRKNRKGDRLFRVEDIKNLQIIYYLLRNKKFSVDGAKKYLKENKKKADVQQQLLQSLTKFRSFLVELKTNLQA